MEAVSNKNWEQFQKNENSLKSWIPFPKDVDISNEGAPKLY